MHAYVYDKLPELELLGRRVGALCTLIDIAKVLPVEDRAGIASQKVSNSSCRQPTSNAASFLFPETLAAP